MEVTILSLSFWYAYSASEYRGDYKPHRTRLGFLAALGHALNPTDLLIGALRIFPLILSLGLGGSQPGLDKRYYARDGQQYGPMMDRSHHRGGGAI